MIDKCINPYAETKREQFNAQDLEKQRYRTEGQRKGEVGGGGGGEARGGNGEDKQGKEEQEKKEEVGQEKEKKPCIHLQRKLSY